MINWEIPPLPEQSSTVLLWLSCSRGVLVGLFDSSTIGVMHQAELSLLLWVVLLEIVGSQKAVRTWWKYICTWLDLPLKGRVVVTVQVVTQLIQLRHYVDDGSTGFSGIYSLLPMFNRCNESEAQTPLLMYSEVLVHVFWKELLKKKKKVKVLFLGISYRTERDFSLVLFWELFFQTLFSACFSVPYSLYGRMEWTCVK